MKYLDKSGMLTILRSAGAIVASAFVGLGALLLVNLIPVDRIVVHVQESIPVLEKEGTYPSMFKWCLSKLDNWTDSIMLGNSAYDGRQSLAEKSLLVYRYRGIDEEGELLDPCESLVLYYSNDESVNYLTVSYSRYWHGYLVLTKPLLYFFNYQTLRVLNFALQLFLTAVVVVLLWKKGLAKIILLYLLVYGALIPPVLGASLQFSTVFYIFSLGVIILLLKYHKWKSSNRFMYFFLTLGIVTAYFDFLTYPVATLGIPLVFYFLLNTAEGASIGADLKSLVRYSLFWGIGYIGMWGSKWILASVLTAENVILNAFWSIVSHTSTNIGTESFSRIKMLMKQAFGIVYNPVTMIALFITVLLFVRAVKYKNVVMRDVIIFGSISLLPLGWYLIASHHSYVHYWFTCKELIVTMFSGMCIFVKSYGFDINNINRGGNT